MIIENEANNLFAANTIRKLKEINQFIRNNAAEHIKKNDYIIAEIEKAIFEYNKKKKKKK